MYSIHADKWKNETVFLLTICIYILEEIASRRFQNTQEGTDKVMMSHQSVPKYLQVQIFLDTYDGMPNVFHA